MNAVAAESFFPDDVEALPEGSHIDGRSVGHPMTASADYVVVGSGAGGATAAVVLAEAGYSVAIVEEGDWVRTREFGKDLWPALATLVRGRGTAVATGRSMIALMQGMCVGGSTTINSAIAWRPPEDVIARWGTDFGIGDAVSMRALEPHFDALERELSVRPVSDEALGQNNAIFGEAATKLGLESHRIKRYDAGCKGSASCINGCRHGKKLGMNITFVPRTLHAGGRIFSGARVERVDVQGGRAVGVTASFAGANGPVPLHIRAKRGVLVAASTVQTPNILRRSGIRARALGRHFQGHPGVSVVARLDREVRMDFGATQGFNSLALLERDGIKLETLSLPTELAVPRLPGFGKELMTRLAEYRSMVTWAVVIKSEAEGTVGEGLLGDAVKYGPTRGDMARATKALRTLCEMLFAVGAKEIYPGAYGMPSVLRSPDDLDHWDRAPADPQAYNMIVSHMFGAARMGHDPRATVCDTSFQTHEAKGLYVVDSSVFPTNLGVNPQHTIMGMARLAATRIAERPLAQI